MARRVKETIPEQASELAAAWFTEIMAPHSHGARVTDVDRSVIGEGVGFVGEIHRCRLTWDRDDDTLPPSVVVKMPSRHGKNRALAEGLMAYEREIRVYRDLGPDLGLPSARLYHVAMDPTPVPWLERFILWLFEVSPVVVINWLTDKFLALAGKSTRRYILVVEDIADARPPEQAKGGSVEDATAALAVLASFHAHNWMRQSVVDANPILWSLDRGPKVVQAGYLRNRDDFEQHFGSTVPRAVFDRLDRIQGYVPELTAHMAGPPWTLLHGDFRLDNVLFRPGGEIVVLDYQAVAVGRPAWDVAYFITTALDPEHLVHEQQMLNAYHHALVGAGVTDYDFDTLLDDVERTKELLVHRIVGGGSMIDTDTDEIDSDDTLLDLLFTRTTGWLDLGEADDAA